MILRAFLAGLAAPLALLAAAPALASPAQPLIVLPGDVPGYRGQMGRGGDITEILASAEQTGGKLGIFRQTIAPGSGPPLHLHEKEVEFAYVVSGRFKFRVADRLVTVPPGAFILAPQMTPHAFKNVGDGPGVLLFGVTPGGLEMMFAERQDVDAKANERLMAKHHMKVVGPPLD